MVDFIAKVGGREVLVTGSVIATDPDPVALQIADLKFRLVFIKTDDGKPTVDGDVDGDTLLVTLRNFDNPLGITWSNDVAEMGGRNLRLQIYVHSLGTEARTRLINYTFSLGEVKSGQ